MISLRALRQRDLVAPRPVTEDDFRSIMDRFENEERRFDPIWVAQKAGERSEEGVWIIFRAIEVYTRDQQLALFERIRQINQNFWQLGVDLLSKNFYRTQAMVVFY